MSRRKRGNSSGLFIKKFFIAMTVMLLLASCTKQRELDESSRDTGPARTEAKTGGTGAGTSAAVDDGPGYILVNPEGMTVASRFNPPAGFSRIAAEPGSFAEYLQKLPLKPAGSPVKYYDGREKGNKVHAAVIDIDVGDRDLQQCADAVMRLRAEYLYALGKYDSIHFNFTNGFNAEYSKWMQGYRISVDGNKASWVKNRDASNEYGSFRKYMDMVFAYAGTLSLSKELKPVEIADMAIGDVFMQGASPGHCVIVVDMAENDETGEKLFMIAQSYMPAQDIHILKNMGDENLSPWYAADFGDILHTPEWEFHKDDLMRFAD